MKRRKKQRVPVMILWDRRQQQRFIEAVEKLVGLVGDLDVLLAVPKRRRAAALAANATRRVNGAAAELVGVAGDVAGHAEKGGVAE